MHMVQFSTVVIFFHYLLWCIFYLNSWIGGLLTTTHYSSLNTFSKFIDAGDNDFLKVHGEELIESCVDPFVIRHPKGHTVPRIGKLLFFSLIIPCLRPFFSQTRNHESLNQPGHLAATFMNAAPVRSAKLIPRYMTVSMPCRWQEPSGHAPFPWEDRSGGTWEFVQRCQRKWRSVLVINTLDH